MALTLNSGDVAGFKVLFSLVILYGLVSFLAYSVLHMKFITPLGMDASLDRFSEARAVEHVRVLAKDIGGRQVGTPGLRQAAEYIKTELETLKKRAGRNVRVEIEETAVNGSFSMIFLGYSISFTYRNLTNIIMRISSVQSGDNDPSVLVNGHFDTTPGSPGAGDCGSCVASILELARVTIDSGWIPPRPVIFLFNGAEELFMLGSHGFITTHRWRETIGAFINVEASGIGGSDLVCQSGPSTWPSQVYSQAALYPMANSAAQDVFGFVPGDTDYRMFAQDYGDIPGLDIIFLLGGRFYHTSSDTVERLLPGSLQARGDNLVSLIRAFTNSSELRNAHERKLHTASQHGLVDERAVFFDFFSWFLIFYTRKAAILLYSVPLAIFLFMPLLLRFRTWGLTCSFATLFDYIKGLLYHAVGLVLAIVVPIIFAVMRLLFSGTSMNWYANPYLAFGMFVPFSLIGLLIPRFAWGHFPLSQNLSLLGLSNQQELVTEARFWGAFGFYSIVTLAYLAAGLNGGFLTFLILVFMILAWISFCLCNKDFGHESLRSTASYVIPAIPCVMYAAYFGGFLAIFLIEKMGMSGSHPSYLYGYFIPDVIVAATIGVISGWCIGPLIPVVGQHLARKSIMQVLLHIGIITMAVASLVFPYSTEAPKRVVFQHTIWNADSSQIMSASYDFAAIDSNSMFFVFKHAPELANELGTNTELSFHSVDKSHPDDWMGIFPVSFLFSTSFKFPTKPDFILNQYKSFPHLFAHKPQKLLGGGTRRIYLEFSLGSLKEVWVSVFNITGPLSSWSFANNKLPAPERDGNGPPSYICRLSGASSENWTFWLEASSSGNIRVEVGVIEQHLTEQQLKLKGLFPNWMDVTAYTSFRSTYVF
ncbi:PREDICTED: endoplasmic reticulum metallopeptidase 1 isoform X1 [Ipomoea nil]|uniref:endoplasmic reticulum metallopeptidase 1 isoform X1 n=1 Tax=Ipomoea nil TaxID=35883 RepID=UPI00090107A2|nr:PREDICTED: endoplasmic reticulum metallopeptidase 1 isoform X1 [Ipomoea nil]